MLLLSILLAAVALVSIYCARRPEYLLRFGPALSRKEMKELGLAGNRYRRTVRYLFASSAIASALLGAWCLTQWRANRDLAEKLAPREAERVEKMRKHSQGKVYVELQKSAGKPGR